MNWMLQWFLYWCTFRFFILFLKNSWVFFFVCLFAALSPDTSVSVFTWQVNIYGQGKPSVYLGLFDINRWYHAQMPDSLRYDFCVFSPPSPSDIVMHNWSVSQCFLNFLLGQENLSIIALTLHCGHWIQLWVELLHMTSWTY